MTVSLTRHFLLKRSELSTLKLFVEFYQPETLELLERLRAGAYHARPLAEVSRRLFDGPFGSDRKIDMYQPSGIPYIRVKDVLPEGINQRELMYISQEKHEEFSRSRVVPGNILMTIAGRVGTAAVFPDDLVQGNITGHIVGIDVPDTINPYYLAAFINSELGQIQVRRWAHRTTRPELNLFEVGQIMIPVPPPAVQDRIAGVMKAAYVSQQEKLEQARTYFRATRNYVLDVLGINVGSLQGRRSAMKPVRQLLGRRIDFESVVTLQEIELGSKDMTALGEVVSQATERVTPVEDLVDQDINYVGLGNIATEIGELTDFQPTPSSEILSSSPRFRAGDILFGRMRPYLNKVWLAEFDGICSGEAVVLRPNTEKVDPHFLQSLLLSQLTLNQVIPLQTGSSLPRVSASDILSVKLPIPNGLEKQAEIAVEVKKRRVQARRLRTEADAIVAEAKARVERMILGED